MKSNLPLSPPSKFWAHNWTARTLSSFLRKEETGSWESRIRQHTGNSCMSMKRTLEPKDKALEQTAAVQTQPWAPPQWLDAHTQCIDARTHSLLQRVFIEHLFHARHLGRENEWPRQCPWGQETDCQQDHTWKKTPDSAKTLENQVPWFGRGERYRTQITGKSLSEEVGSELNHRGHMSSYVRQCLGQT